MTGLSRIRGFRIRIVDHSSGPGRCGDISRSKILDQFINGLAADFTIGLADAVTGDHNKFSFSFPILPERQFHFLAISS